MATTFAGFVNRTPPHNLLLTGGAGGTLYTVSNLNDSGAGSFREAWEATGTRIIKFGVSGWIDLESPAICGDDNVTVDGACAPNGGIGFRSASGNFAGGSLIAINRSNVWLRHIRIMPGVRGYTPGIDEIEIDALLLSGFDGGVCRDVWIDHCSLFWGNDTMLELWAGAGGVSNVAITNCIIAEALRANTHPSGNHSTGVLIGFSAHDILFANNLIAHCLDRVPYISDGWNINLINNVVYNSSNQTMKADYQGQGATGPATYDINVIGNNIIRGPDSNNSATSQDKYAWRGFDSRYNVFVSDNVAANAQIHPDSTGTEAASVFNFGTYTTRPAAAGKAFVLANAGATLPRQSPTDARIISEVSAGGGGAVDTITTDDYPDLSI